MKKIIIISLLLCSIGASAQRKHVYVDTIKTTQVRVDYSPDTIPVYFKELIIKYHGDRQDGLFGKIDDMYEKWQEGFVVWQTYRKPEPAISFSGSGYSSGILSGVEYYKEDYEPSRLAAGKFLYIDKKPVTNKVIFSIKK